MICNLKQNRADDPKVTLKVDIVSLFQGCVGNPWHLCQMSFYAENSVYTGTDASEVRTQKCGIHGVGRNCVLFIFLS